MKKIFFVLVVALAFVEAGAQKVGEVSKQLKIFNQLCKTLDEYYVDTLDSEKNVTVAIQSMLNNLDPYTEYYTAKEASDFNSLTTGKYAGVGSVIHYYKPADRCIIYQLYEGMPAQKAGLKVGDVIMSVNGKDVGAKGSMALENYTSSVSSALRGDPGTVAKVVVKRPGVEEPMEFEVTRASVQLPSVPYYGMVSEGVGYVYLSSFTTDCSKDVKKALIELKQKGAKSLVLDLRNNGGGLAIEAVRIVNLFVPKGKLILKMKGKFEEANTTYATQDNPEDLDMPVVVLVNENSASASEITCGSMQDLDRGVIVGERTFGKGLVQQTFGLPYDGMVKMTTSHYYIPSGRCIQALDYSHRTNDGEAYRMPDSLTKVFTTEAGRKVKDGGGITPDIAVKGDSLPTSLAYLCASDEYLDYITKYCQAHPSIAAADKFMISDSDYAEFVDYVVKSGYAPERSSTKAIEALRKIAKAEDASEESLKMLKAFEESLKPDFSNILPKHKEQMAIRLSCDISERYYYNAGAIATQLSNDKQLDAAVAVLKDSARYKKILKK